MQVTYVSFVIILFSEETARFYFRQLVDGVQYCHENGIFIVLELITGGELFDKIVSEGRHV
ncbi:hypothetical protein DD237_006212 [Peronospora effusa]|uniref:Protein kinase domain-containing protein n=1 Tax=Peronospora effusa TaxID=542832 RepID=A0A3R7W2M8_9STRA|nr:hypothetical protein DD237_006212 [Peronospora effusa]